MHNCALCNQPLHPCSEWKGTDGYFYCSEFCADSGEPNAAPVLSKDNNVASIAGAPR
jgi:hypothetical protein